MGVVVRYWEEGEEARMMRGVKGRVGGRRGEEDTMRDTRG